MLPFTFKISVKCQTMHFFPKTEEFPFFVHQQAREEHLKIEVGVQKSFERLLVFQKYIKRRVFEEWKIDKLLCEINEFMAGTNAIWTKTSEIGIDDFDFYVFTLKNRSQISLSLKTRRKRNCKRPGHTVEPSNPSYLVYLLNKKETTPFFRPWL